MRIKHLFYIIFFYSLNIYCADAQQITLYNLYHAIELGQVGIVKALVEKNPELIDVVSKEKYSSHTPFTKAIFELRREPENTCGPRHQILYILLKNRADVNLANAFGYLLEMNPKKLYLIESFLSLGANPDQIYALKKLRGQISCEFREIDKDHFIEILKLLLKYGADYNAIRRSDINFRVLKDIDMKNGDVIFEDLLEIAKNEVIKEYSDKLKNAAEKIKCSDEEILDNIIKIRSILDDDLPKCYKKILQTKKNDDDSEGGAAAKK